MNLAPVIERELRVEARSNLGFWLRMLSAGGMIVVMLPVMQHQGQMSNANLGNLLFNFLNRTLLAGILIIAPLLTADCISRERREGTLGLLFLTPLRAHEVVWAKVIIQVVRGLLLLLSALPLMGLPFVLGGVTLSMGIQAALVQFCALLAGLSAGMLASATNVEWTPAVVKAELLGGLAAIGLRSYLLDGFDGHWLIFLPGLGCAVLLFLGIVRLTTEKVTNHASDHSGIQKPAAWVSLFSDSEFWRLVFRWDKGPTLDRNPIAWLQEYSWSARLTKWAWVLVMQMLVLGCGFSSRASDFFISQFALTQLTFLMAAGMAFTATASFRRERENGALELLLVTPIRPSQLIVGRLWGMFCHFFPVGAILGLFWAFELGYGGSIRSVQVIAELHAFSTLIFAPVIGLAVSLVRVNFVLAWLATCVASYFLPSLVMAAFGVYSLPRRVAVSAEQIGWIIASEVAIGFWIARSLNRKLTDRTFALAQS